MPQRASGIASQQETDSLQIKRMQVPLIVNGIGSQILQSRWQCVGEGGHVSRQLTHARKPESNSRSRLGCLLDSIRQVQHHEARHLGCRDPDHHPAIISGGAVKKAAGKVRAQVLELASKMLDAPVDKLDCANNEVFTTCVCRKAVTMTDLAMQAMYKEKLQIMDGASHFNTDSPPPFCATFAEVEVDTETGQVRVLHIATAVDPGTAVNPMQSEGQVEGAVTQGMGFALTEELLLDGGGRPLNANFTDYKIFSAKDRSAERH